jgi:GNAT superfamily N-acetyltransferase
LENKIKYRIATREDYPAVLLLYNKMYKSNRRLEDFEWLIEDNPAGRATLFIASLGEIVVGMQSLIPYLFLRNGKLFHTFKSEDTLVDKKFRGKGIFSRLYEMVHAHAADTLVWGLTDKKEILTHVAMPSSERLTIAVSVKKPSLDYNKNGFQRFVAKTLFYSFLYLKLSFRTKEMESVFTLKELSPKEYGKEDLQLFFKEMSHNNPDTLYPKMELDYLEWRLTKNPNLARYQIVCSYDDEGAIMICSIIGLQDKNAYWQSFYAKPNVPKSEKIAHVVKLKEKIFDSRVNLIHSWLFECNTQVSEVKELFYQAGFSKVRDGLWIVHNSTDKDIDAHDLYFSPQLGIR